MSEPTRQEQEGERPDEERPDEERPGDERLLEALSELLERMSRAEAAALLGVSVRTVIRTSSEQRLTARMRDTLTLRIARDRDREGAGAEAASDGPPPGTDDLARRVTQVEERVEALEETAGAVPAVAPVAGAAERAAGAERPAPTTSPVPGVKRAVIGRGPAVTPRRPHPELVTLEAEEGEERVYGRAAPLIVEWRRVRAGHLDERGSRVEQATDWVRMCELELVLIGEHGLTLPPDRYPWDRFQRRDELRRRELWLGYARAEHRRALVWRSLRRVLTLGIWRR